MITLWEILLSTRNKNKIIILKYFIVNIFELDSGKLFKYFLEIKNSFARYNRSIRLLINKVIFRPFCNKKKTNLIEIFEIFKI